MVCTCQPRHQYILRVKLPYFSSFLIIALTATANMSAHLRECLTVNVPVGNDCCIPSFSITRVDIDSRKQDASPHAIAVATLIAQRTKRAFLALTRLPRARGTGCRRCIRSAFAPVTLHDGALGGKVEPGHMLTSVFCTTPLQ